MRLSHGLYENICNKLLYLNKYNNQAISIKAFVMVVVSIGTMIMKIDFMNAREYDGEI